MTEFPPGAGTTESTLIRASATCNNTKIVIGGEDEPSIESLRQIALLNRNSQNRIVSREDLLARVYSLPNNFGRVFRASVRDNPNNPQAAQLFVLSRNSDGDIIFARHMGNKNGLLMDYYPDRKYYLASSYSIIEIFPPEMKVE